MNTERIDFARSFTKLTGCSPFPWQQEMYSLLAAGNFRSASPCSLPTGLGKTKIIHLWLLALATAPNKVPRRLVYVVNRRTIVDQATREVEELRERLGDVDEVVESLRRICAVESDPLLAISTLRGEHADNRQWLSDPTRPAAIIGTVDMIGSRLLFSGYGCGFKRRPFDAGFLGQDVLFIHDEAHLEPAFQSLLTAIQEERERSKELPGFHVIELTATTRGKETPFGLKPADMDDQEVRNRVWARKRITLHQIDDDKKTADAVTRLALAYEGSNRAVLLFLRRLEDIEKVTNKLPAERVKCLTGTLRGYEREELVSTQVFQRFLPPPDRRKDVTPATGTVYLVCTSAGEVGINISADHLVCDLTPFDSMAQRFGRVNRFGIGDARIEIVYPNTFDSAKRLDEARANTLERLKELPSLGKDVFDGRPAALGGLLSKLTSEQIDEIYTPHDPPLVTSAILFDNWALTTARDLPGRLAVADYLHGPDSEAADTYFAWREEVGFFDFLLMLPDSDRRQREEDIEDHLDEYPLKPHELLRETTVAVMERHLKELAKRAGNMPAWLINSRGIVKVCAIANVSELSFRELVNHTIVLPPAAGGLRRGMLDGKAGFDSEIKYDVADAFSERKDRPRMRFLQTGAATEDDRIGELYDSSSWRLLGHGPAVTATPNSRGNLPGYVPLPEQQLERDQDGNARQLVSFVRAKDEEGDETQSRLSVVEQMLTDHLGQAARFANQIAQSLHLSPELRMAVISAARWHDLGKDRRVWQRGIGNTKYPDVILAKSGHGRRVKSLERYRHEFGSLLELHREKSEYHKEFKRLTEEQQDLVLHLIAAHHGRARPHFPQEEAFDPERGAELAEEVAREVPRRFARLQRKYGRWGLAYLESLVRAADILASQPPKGGKP